MKQTLALGIDPGLANTGYALLSRNRLGKFSMLSSGCIQTDKTDTDAKRLLEIYTDVTCLIREHTPDIIAIEKVFWNKNITSALSTQGVISVCLLSAEQVGIRSREITPQTAKAFATGSGLADKAHVRKCVEKLTGTEIKNSHTADAAAVAIAALMQPPKAQSTLRT